MLGQACGECLIPRGSGMSSLVLATPPACLLVFSRQASLCFDDGDRVVPVSNKSLYIISYISKSGAPNPYDLPLGPEPSHIPFVI